MVNVGLPEGASYQGVNVSKDTRKLLLASGRDGDGVSQSHWR